MHDKNYSEYTDFDYIMKLCTKCTQSPYHKQASSAVPDYWQTKEGKILWLQPENAKNEPDIGKTNVRLATAEELLTHPEVRKGAIALVSQIEQYQQQLNARDTTFLDKKRARWAPSISNYAQTDELQFGQTLEQFLAQYQHTMPVIHGLKNRFKNWCFPLCLAIEEKALGITKKRWLLPTMSIQNFKERFNCMMERRIALLNRQLERTQNSTIGFIPLVLESDCTPKLIAKKISLLNEIEKQSMANLIENEVEHFASRIAKTPYHVVKQIQPLLQMVSLWHTLWPGKEDEIKKQVILRLQAIRIHPGLVNNQPRVEGVLRKAEALL
ncbi:MAG: hypothetical protein OXD32_07815 [Endozoicomonadaceae bacterium]|nr:hypothetical protein [Endozoicomonadaceae bacterium]MCY4328706.1 hypothetical protein [Endozoicomonadaceae bacterium]